MLISHPPLKMHLGADKKPPSSKLVIHSTDIPPVSDQNIRSLWKRQSKWRLKCSLEPAHPQSIISYCCVRGVRLVVVAHTPPQRGRSQTVCRPEISDFIVASASLFESSSIPVMNHCKQSSGQSHRMQLSSRSACVSKNYSPPPTTTTNSSRTDTTCTTTDPTATATTTTAAAILLLFQLHTTSTPGSASSLRRQKTVASKLSFLARCSSSLWFTLLLLLLVRPPAVWPWSQPWLAHSWLSSSAAKCCKVIHFIGKGCL